MTRARASDRDATGVSEVGLTGHLRAAVRLGVRASQGYLYAVVAATVVAAVAPVVAAACTSAIIDTLAGDGRPHVRLLWACVALAGATLVLALLPILTEYAEAEVGRRVGLLAQDELYQALDRVTGLAPFEDPGFRDRLAVAEASGGTIPGVIIGSGLRAAAAVATAGSFFVTIAVTAQWLALFLVAAAVPMLLAELSLARHLAATTYRVESIERRERFFASLICDLRAAKEVRLFALSPWLRVRVRQHRETINAEQRRMDRRRVRIQSALKLLSVATAVAGLAWAVRAASRGVLTPGGVAMFLAATAGVQGALATVATAASVLRRHGLLFAHYRAVVTAPPDLPVPAPPRPLSPLRDRIELRDVWFRYHEGQPWVLRGVDLAIERGTSLAIVGTNGAGKSTLIRLLCRFYDPQRGAVLWDGVDIRTVPVEDLRARMAVLFQDFMEYELTAAENIAVGDLSRMGDPDTVRTAARRARIHDTIAALPEEYETMLSRTFLAGPDDTGAGNGVILSGGQWQRISLARALLREPRDLLVLDEPTSGMDPQAEHELYTELRHRRPDQTHIVVTHRLAGARGADVVAVLHDGVVVERGSHDALIAAGGRYARMFGLQGMAYRTSTNGRPAEVAG